MDDKDKEAFEKWWDEIRLRGQSTFGIVAITWQAACEYKQKEIDELLKQLKHENDLYKKHLKVYEDENAKLIEQDQIISQEIKTYIHIADRLKGENAKLRECVEFYAQPWERGELDGELLVRKSESYDLFTEVHYKAKQCLKELEDK
jgi:hypothetical protein